MRACTPRQHQIVEVDRPGLADAIAPELSAVVDDDRDARSISRQRLRRVTRQDEELAAFPSCSPVGVHQPRGWCGVRHWSQYCPVELVLEQSAPAIWKRGSLAISIKIVAVPQKWNSPSKRLPSKRLSCRRTERFAARKKPGSRGCSVREQRGLVAGDGARRGRAQGHVSDERAPREGVELLARRQSRCRPSAADSPPAGDRAAP